MLRKFQKRYRARKLSIKTKLTLGLGSIAAMLLLSSIISVLEYRRMSNYVADLVAANIKSIEVAQKLASGSDEYNLKILAAIGDEASGRLPDFDRQAFFDQCDSLRMSLGNSKEVTPMADSVLYSFTAYMLTSMELEKVMLSDFIDSRDWYFGRLQPSYNRLRSDIEKLTNVAYNDLQENSLTFQDSFYRSIIPGVVSVGAGLILVLLLYFFITVYYADPLYRMLTALKNYGLTGVRYNCTFDGKDELSALNAEIADVVDENVELKRRNKILRERVAGTSVEE
ncbi:MAG: hypothetical protein NC115_08640 [Bacteroidales bacterium]|nr:hypothetical protein [Bacteroidales bacterium]